MKRSNSSEFSSDTKRFEAYPPPTHYQPQQHLQHQQQQQQQQIQAQQQQQQQYQAQQQQQFQMQQQIQAVQQQQQQQYAANQQFYNQAAYYPMNSVNFPPYVPSQPPMLYNNSPSWNFMSPSPPYFSTTPTPTPGPSQPPLPPPELKAEKPPLPKDPEPGFEAVTSIESGSLGSPMLGFNGICGPVGGSRGGIRIRGINGINAGLFNGFNGGMRAMVGGRPTILSPNGNGIMHSINVNKPPPRGRRRNPHFFPQMQSPLLGQPMEFQRPGDFNEFARLIEEDQPAGPEKLTIYLNNADNGRVQVNKKAKRKPMSTRYARTKLWTREEAEAAIALEKEYNRMQKRPMLILKFPDPDLNKYIVKKYSPLIDTVHFQQPSTPRYCFVQLKEDADVEKVINTIRQIPFGTGKISAELKNQHIDDQPVTPEEIDPYTLYIGNLPTHISVRVVKEYFPNAQRIDIGYAQRMRYTRYAFIRYNTVAEAMASYRNTVNALVDSRSLIVRFRRQKGNIGLPGETKINQPRREGREILPQSEPRPLDHQDVEQELEDFPEEGDLENIEEDVDDEEEDVTEAEVEEPTVKSLKEMLVNPVAKRNPTPPSSAPPSAPPVAAKTPPVDAQPEKVIPPQPKDSEKTPETQKVTDPQVPIAPNKSPEHVASSVRPIVAPEVIESHECIEDDVDNKANVLKEAAELMKKNKNRRYRRLSSPSIFAIYGEPPMPGPVEGDIKLEQSDEDESSGDGVHLFQARVKDEPREETNKKSPLLDDLYLDDYEYDDIDCEPEEEDDEWATGTEITTNSMCGRNWDEPRRSELNVREDKPDLEKLDSIRNLLPSASIPAISVDIEPKFECDDYNENKDSLAEKDDLHEMFAQLNSDTEGDDDDEFFG